MSRSCTSHRRAAALVLAGTATVALAPSAVAQTSGLPSGGGVAQPAPGSRTYTPDQLGAVSSAQRYMITSSANDRGAFLWIVDSIERKVTLCEKPGAATDFTCTKKALP